MKSREVPLNATFIDATGEVINEKLAQQEEATPEADAVQITVKDAIAPTPKPSAFESVKSFFKNKNVRIGLIVAGIIIGVGLMCTGIGMLGVLCAGAVAAGGVAAAVSASMVAAFGGAVGFTLSFSGFLFAGIAMLLTGMGSLGARMGMNKRAAQTPTGDGAKIGRTDTQVADTLSQEQTANGKRLASEVSPEDDARMLAQMRAEEIAPRKPTRCSEGMMRISQWVFVQPSNVSAPANVTSSTNRLG